MSALTTVFWTILLLVFVPLRAQANETECPKGIVLPAEKNISVAGRELTAGEFERLKQLLANLNCIQREVYEKPEILIQFPSNKKDSGLGTYSVYLREGYIYPGHFLAAWHDRMVGRSSRVYEIDDATRVFLSH